jgi:hypothetical protein|tara:strand:- start:1052 stop:1225 length:174 start_codon:yes stop_codon:yes gene_type:complete
MKQKIDYRIIITAMLCITGLEIYALSQGINGVLLTTVIGVLAAIVGIAIPKEKIIKE